MNKNRIKTFLLGLLAIALIFGSLFVFKKHPTVASYSYYESLKIAPSSLNGNSIWGGGETFDTIVTAKGLDAWAAFYSASQKASGGLDPSGALSINGVPYQMSWTGASDYTGNDTIRLYSGHTSTRINLDTIGAYEHLYVLGTAGGPGEGNYANFAVRVNYTDGSIDETSYRLYDWYDATPVSGVYKWPNLARRQVVTSNSGRVGSNTNNYIYEGSTTDAPYLQSATIKVDAKKLVSSIDLVLTGRNDSTSIEGIYCGIYAITGMVNISAPGPVETIYINDVTETTANIYWESVPKATSYRLDIALDPDFKNILPDYNNRLINDVQLLAEGLNGDTTYYTRVRAENSEGQSISSNVVDFHTLNETIPPEVSLDGKPNLIQINDLLIITATDISGVRDIEESLDNGETWYKIADGDYTEKTVTENATYCYRATDVYGNISDKSCITYNNLDTKKPVIVVNTNGYEEGTWTNSPVTLTIESLTNNVGTTRYYYSTDGTNWQDYQGSVVYNGETTTDGIIYYFKAISEAGVESDVVSALVKKDNTAPSGEISSEEGSWNEFLNTITFGLFFNKTVDFDISASDELSGVKSVEYLVTKTQFETKEEAEAAEGWEIVDGPVSIKPEKDFILYYKLTDNVGNVSIINTEGVVLDTTEALIEGYVDADHTYELEDGATYYLAHTIIVTDNKALAEIKINNSPVQIGETNIIELNGSDNNVYVVEATDKAGNKTVVTLNIGHIGDYNLNVDDSNYKTDDKNDIEEAKEKLGEILEEEGSHATEEEIEVINELIEKYEDLLDKIDNLENEINDEKERSETIPDIDHVTSEDKEDIVELLNDIINTLDEDSAHLTIDELNELIEEKNELEDKLNRLEDVEEKEEDLNIVNQTDTEVIKTNDKEELEDLKAEAEELLNGNNLTEEEREEVQAEKDKIDELLERIEEAEEAKDTEDIREADLLLPDNYTRDDKTELEEAKEDLESALDNYNSNYTEEEIAEILEKLDQINDALDDIARQEEEEIRRTTFPEISVSAETTRWISEDIAGIVTSDKYGIKEIAVSRDGGETWEILTSETSTTFQVLENDTYIFRATNLFDNTKEQTVVYHNIDPIRPIVEIDSHGYVLGTWTNQSVVLTASNVANNIAPVALYMKEQDKETWQAYSETIITEDTDSKVYEYKAVSATGLESEIVAGEVKKDTIAPTGSISSEENSWTTFLNSITFKLFFNKTKDFTFTASDDRSGVETVEYTISETGLNADNVDSVTWNPVVDSVSVEPEKDFAVYYKITDKAGNASIINTDGIVLDVTAPTIMGYSGGETYELEPEKTYYLTQKLLVNDNKAIDVVKVNGNVVVPNNGIIEIPGNQDGTATITVKDKAGNEKTITIKTGKITIPDDLEHKTINDKPELEEELDKLENLENENPESAEQELIEAFEEEITETIEEIDDTEEKVGIIEESYATIPDIDHVTSEDEDKIKNLIEAIETVEEENGNHLTDEERQELDNMLDDLNQKLERIEDVKEQLTEVDEGVNSYDKETVTKDDLDELEELRHEIEDLKNNDNVSEREKEHLDDLLDKIDMLEEQIRNAEEAIEAARENDGAKDITPENVVPEDQTTLEDAAQGYAEALGVFDGNFSLSDLFDINNRISIINSALDILDQVAEFENMVSRLPNPENINYGSRAAIKAAQIAYNELSVYGRSLVGPSLMAKYKAIIEAYRAYLESSPILYAFETLDVFWWGLSTFFIVGIFIVATRRTHKRYVEEENDNF